MNCDVGEVSESLENELCSSTSQLILQPFRRFIYVSSFSNPFRCFTYVTAHSPTVPSLYLRHSSFFKPIRCFTYVTAHSPTLPSLYLRHSSFSNPSLALPTSQLILQPLPLLLLRHSSFSDPSFASPTSQDFHLRHLASRPWSVFLCVCMYKFMYVCICTKFGITSKN